MLRRANDQNPHVLRLRGIIQNWQTENPGGNLFELYRIIQSSDFPQWFLNSPVVFAMFPREAPQQTATTPLEDVEELRRLRELRRINGESLHVTRLREIIQNWQTENPGGNLFELYRIIHSSNFPQWFLGSPIAFAMVPRLEDQDLAPGEAPRRSAAILEDHPNNDAPGVNFVPSPQSEIHDYRRED